MIIMDDSGLFSIIRSSSEPLMIENALRAGRARRAKENVLEKAERAAARKMCRLLMNEEVGTGRSLKGSLLPSNYSVGLRRACPSEARALAALTVGYS